MEVLDIDVFSVNINVKGLGFYYNRLLLVYLVTSPNGLNRYGEKHVFL